jgi:adenylate cyclase
LCLAVVAYLMILRPPFLQRIDMGIYDVFLKAMESGEPSPVPVLVDIDERSIGELGQWPWPRYRLAELLTALNDCGVLSVGVDILMSEPDRTSPELWANRLKRDFGVVVELRGLPPELMDNDRYLASVIEKLPVAISAQAMENAPASPVKSFPVIEMRAGGAPPLAELLAQESAVLMPLPVLAEAASAIGLINAAGDVDGVFRRVPLFVAVNGAPVPSLALAALALGAGEKSVVARVRQDGFVSVKVAGVEVPLSHGGVMPVAFRGGEGVYPRFSAVDVLNGRVPRENLAGRVAFVGSTAAGLRDLRPAPFDAAYPGLELHAAVVDSILSGRFIRMPLNLLAWEMGLLLVAGLASMALFGLTRPQIALLPGAILAAGVWFGCRHAMISAGAYITPLYALTAIFVEGFSTFSLRFLFEEREKRLLRRAFSSYVAPEVVGRILESGGASSLRGEQRIVSVLFTDLRGFTSLTEKMPPTEVVEMLDSYFTPMTSIVRGSLGTLDKFVGDSLMAFWNAPTDVPDHAYRAVRSLLDMHAALEKLNERLAARFGVRLRMGGAVHTGAAHVGNMGTSELMDYTAIGDTVNIASRLGGMCPEYGVGVVISGDTADLCDERIALMPLDLVKLRGRSAATPIFTACTPEEAEKRREETTLWKEAFALCQSGDFRSAEAICVSLTQSCPDVELYRIFAKRAARGRKRQRR